MVGKFQLATPEIMRQTIAAGMGKPITPEVKSSAKKVAAKSTSSILEGWRERLMRDEVGKIRPILANAVTALETAPEWQGVLGFDESTLRVVVLKKPPVSILRTAPFAVDDQFDSLVTVWLQHHDVLVGSEIAGQAINSVAKAHPFHPIRKYLESLKWDGVKRISDLGERYLGAASSPYVRAVSRKFMISGVARIYQPGCKVDTAPILEGSQGAGKSTFVRELFGSRFFTDDVSDLGNKDSVMQTRGVWVVELSELDAMTRADVSKIKAFVSRQVDRIRLPYGKRVVEFPRECVFVGTSNKDSYLSDETGGRRFWPIKCGKIDIEALRRDRDQLWAEARDAYLAKENWWLDASLIQVAADEVAERLVADPWDEMIAQWIKHPKPGCNPLAPSTLDSTSEFVTAGDILTHCIGKLAASWTQPDQNRVARSLVALGWKRQQRRINGKRVWGYALVSPVVTSVD